MQQTAAELYLDLMKKTLSFMLWPEPPVPLSTFNYQRTFIKRTVVSAVSRLLAAQGLALVQEKQPSLPDRTEGLTYPMWADTMIGLKRMDNIQECVETALRDQVPGDLIETGAWRGGACIFMRAILAALCVADRRVFVADSFQGLPPPDAEAYPADAGDRHHTHPYLAVSKEEVERNFAKYGLLDEQVVFLKGWFKDTLPSAPIRNLAVLRLDGDMYGSTMETLEILYPKLSPGGFCIIDDYALAGCKQAVDDYREKHQIHAELKVVDWTGRFWRKPW